MGARRVLLVVGAFLAATAVGLVAALVIGGGEEAEAQTIRFQEPADAGPEPFTAPADVRGSRKVRIEPSQTGSGPFGGTGSDRVCDRELLIRSLRAQPERMRAWAEVLGVEPTARAVARYIRGLTPVTLTRDARVTNHSFEDGRAVGFQAILQAGTAVLVDDDGTIVVRCRCGNPLTEPVFIEEAECIGCPPGYEPPTDSECREGDCWKEYPDPPPVRGRGAGEGTREPGGGGATESPSASWNRADGNTGDSYTLSVSGFAPNTELDFTLTRPDGTTESHTITTDAAGNGSYSFPATLSGTITGDYVAVVRNPQTGAEATATTHFSGDAQEEPPPDEEPPPSDEEPPPSEPGPEGGEESDLPVCDPVAPVEPCRPG